MSQPLPVWLATGTVQAVWPSRFLALKRCMLREAAVAGGQGPLMPISPRAQLGTGIHLLFERGRKPIPIFLPSRRRSPLSGTKW